MLILTFSTDTNYWNKKITQCIYTSTLLIQSRMADAVARELAANKAKRSSGDEAVLSFTFCLQLASLQTGHPFNAVTNFCQYQLREEEVERSCGGQ